MAHNLQRATAAINAETDAVCALLNSGFIRIYTASQPADANTAISGPTLLAELTFGATAFGSAVAGVATANAITSDSSANNTGTAAWARLFKTDGTTSVMDCTVGTTGCDINLTTTSITSGGTVAISSLTYTAKKDPC